MLTLPKELLDRFQKLIYEQSSLKFSPARLNDLEKQLRERVKTREVDSIEDYFRLLQEDQAELNTLIQNSTIKETFFFRLPAQFKAFRENLLPEIEENLSCELRHQMAEGKSACHVPFRIWSAGCATGEEPYSIAMTMLEGLKYPRAWEIEILATDISREAVAAASLAYYETPAIDRMPGKECEKYTSLQDGGGIMADKLREMISFRTFNLRNIPLEKEKLCVLRRTDGIDEYFNFYEYFNIIFCRNVMIYFDFEAQQRLVDNLYACLKPGGYLFTGDAELLHIYEHDFQTVEKEGSFFYKKL